MEFIVLHQPKGGNGFPNFSPKNPAEIADRSPALVFWEWALVGSNPLIYKDFRWLDYCYCRDLSRLLSSRGLSEEMILPLIRQSLDEGKDQWN